MGRGGELIRRITAVSLALAIVSGVPGCVLTPGSSLTSAEARDAFYAVLDGTESELGGTWDTMDDPTARGCGLPLWVEGTRYPGLRIGPAPASATEALDAVSAYWDELGLSIERSEVGDAVELAGTSQFGQLVQFRASPDGMTLQGESECRPS